MQPNEAVSVSTNNSYSPFPAFGADVESQEALLALSLVLRSSCSSRTAAAHLLPLFRTLSFFLSDSTPSSVVCALVHSPAPSSSTMCILSTFASSTLPGPATLTTVFFVLPFFSTCSPSLSSSTTSRHRSSSVESSSMARQPSTGSNVRARQPWRKRSSFIMSESGCSIRSALATSHSDVEA
jgi:hypothetical protein